METTRIFASLEATTQTMTESADRFDIRYQRDGIEVLMAVLKPTYENRRDLGKKTRVYVHGQEEVSFDDLPDGWMYDASPEIVKECKRRNRQELKNMRALIAEAVRLIPTNTVEEMGRSKLGFSRHAGCSMCPCSPGFVADRQLKMTINEYPYVVSDIWVTKK